MQICLLWGLTVPHDSNLIESSKQTINESRTVLDYTVQPNQSQIDLMTRGMDTWVVLLGGIVQGFEDKQHH